ncbi:thermonuclease family protein [Pseudomonas sessilinigenes]|uniref:Thermonuclease family protein n=1 Tax=Pseudomonas sessilinigenes TaxID=658629 RepID=A0ABX8MPR1_9PSED|nr:thermonuclease family protein [Pseudomonas sessilinigenes]AZC22151.1 nuclease, putative [Pseudomonas sessilinigenes]QXH41241.1 thermonuclease family protein [Pseudomonas sessilinigenes]
MKKASLVGAFFVPAIWLTAAQAFCPAPAPASLTPAVVARVVDGDTLRLKDGRSVRMIGLNAPELAAKGRLAEPLAVAARRRLEQLVARNGGRVGLVPGRERFDRYGRTLAHVYGANGVNFEARLIAEGLAYHIALAPNVALVACQQAAENHARRARLGLWRRSPVLKPEQIRSSGFAVLSGRVSGVQRNRNGVWITLNGAVVLRIAPNIRGRFPPERLKGLVGRRVEARGWVVDRHQRGRSSLPLARWMISIKDPSMLRLL